MCCTNSNLSRYGTSFSYGSCAEGGHAGLRFIRIPRLIDAFQPGTTSLGLRVVILAPPPYRPTRDAIQ